MVDDAFGKPTTYGAGTYNNRFKFTGREYLPEFNVYEYRARLYHPGLGRFMSEDPKGFEAGDYNLFRYCKNDPVDFVDPDGEVAQVVIGAYVAAEAAATVYDVRFAIQTLNDSNASSVDKSLAVGGALAGIQGPLGGYGKAALSAKLALAAKLNERRWVRFGEAE